MNKAQLRKSIRVAIAAMTDDERRRAADQAAERLLDSGVVRGKVAVYMALPSEMQTRGLIDACLQKGLQVCLPVVCGDDLMWVDYTENTTFEAGAWGIEEPIGPLLTTKQAAFDVCVTPLTAMDRRGNRVGKGKGFYDRALAQSECIRVGYGYDCQLVEQIDDVSELDLPMHWIATPSVCKEIRCVSSVENTRAEN